MVSVNYIWILTNHIGFTYRITKNYLGEEFVLIFFQIILLIFLLISHVYAKITAIFFIREFISDREVSVSAYETALNSDLHNFKEIGMTFLSVHHYSLFLFLYFFPHPLPLTTSFAFLYYRRVVSSLNSLSKCFQLGRTMDAHELSMRHLRPDVPAPAVWSLTPNHFILNSV